MLTLQILGVSATLCIQAELLAFSLFGHALVSNAGPWCVFFFFGPT
jgi:hypothetical protein